MTTEREQLVERVAREIAKSEGCDPDELYTEPYKSSDPFWTFYTDAARAAIAEIERTHIPERDRDAFIINNLNANISKLEAEAAAMRVALDKIEGQAVCFNMDGDAGNETMLRNIANMARAALSPEAGQRVLDVVKAAEDLVVNIREHGLHDNWKGLAEALAALGGEQD